MKKKLKSSKKIIEIIIQFVKKRNKNYQEKVSREKGKFVTTVYKKPTFSGVCTYFGSFLPTAYKFVSFIIVVAFKICSDWINFYEEISFLK